MDEANEQRAHKLLVSRLEAMGIEMTPLPGGRSALGELILLSARFQGLTSELEIPRVKFATAGSGQLKCLAPEALFQLPMISVTSCNDARQIEDRIRATWSRHIHALKETARTLAGIGSETREESGGAGLAFPLGLEDEHAVARCLDARHVVVPGRGPLSGLVLASPRHRIARLDATAESAVDLEIALTCRIEGLGREADRAEQNRRLSVANISPSARAAEHGPETPDLRPTRPASGGRVLLVGAILGRDQALRTALRRLGLNLRIEYSSADALAAFRTQTFDIVLTDSRLGRSEGIELIPEIRGLPGIDLLPIVLVDEHDRGPRKEAARSLGAAGYLVHPIDVDRILPGIQRLAGGQRGRRFSRLDHRLPVEWQGASHGFTLSIGRGGMFVRSESGLLLPNGEILEIALPELGERIRIEGREVYRKDAAGSPEPGVGVRFQGFPDRNEALGDTITCAAKTGHGAQGYPSMSPPGGTT